MKIFVKWKSLYEQQCRQWAQQCSITFIRNNNGICLNCWSFYLSCLRPALFIVIIFMCNRYMWILGFKQHLPCIQMRTSTSNSSTKMFILILCESKVVLDETVAVKWMKVFYGFWFAVNRKWRNKKKKKLQICRTYIVGTN